MTARTMSTRTDRWSVSHWGCYLKAYWTFFCNKISTLFLFSRGSNFVSTPIKVTFSLGDDVITLEGIEFRVRPQTIGKMKLGIELSHFFRLFLTIWYRRVNLSCVCWLKYKDFFIFNFTLKNDWFKDVELFIFFLFRYFGRDDCIKMDAGFDWM